MHEALVDWAKFCSSRFPAGHAHSVVPKHEKDTAADWAVPSVVKSREGKSEGGVVYAS